MKLKKTKQKLAVLIEINRKVYQVALSREQVDSLVFILPQLYDDNIIKVMEGDLPVTISYPHK